MTIRLQCAGRTEGRSKRHGVEDCRGGRCWTLSPTVTDTGVMAVTIQNDNEVEQTASSRSQRPSARALDLLSNVAVLGALWLLYTAVRTVTAEEWSIAVGNAREVVSFQRSLGLPSELVLQQDLLDRTGIVKMANIYYIAAHFPVTIGFLLFAWAFRRHQFGRIRNTLIAVSATGMLIHLVYPLAPPRLMQPVFGFVDTGALFGPSPYDLGVAEAANQLAAMPSLHVGWSLLVAIGVIWMFDSRWRWLVLVHPAITTVVVVLTANHYWIDAFIAALLVGLVWAAQSLRLQRALSWV